MCQKSPVVCQKSPVVCQNSPVICQNSPVVCQKSPVVCQESPIARRNGMCVENCSLAAENLDNVLWVSAVDHSGHCGCECVAVCYRVLQRGMRMSRETLRKLRCNTLQHTATHCNTLQHAATQRGMRMFFIYYFK